MCCIVLTAGTSILFTRQEQYPIPFFLPPMPLVRPPCTYSGSTWEESGQTRLPQAFHCGQFLSKQGKEKTNLASSDSKSNQNMQETEIRQTLSVFTEKISSTSRLGVPVLEPKYCGFLTKTPAYTIMSNAAPSMEDSSKRATPPLHHHHSGGKNATPTSPS